MSHEIHVLTKEELQTCAPAVFAQKPRASLSNKYIFIPTDKIIDHFATENWFPVKASQAKSKKPDVVERSHIIRLSNPTLTPVMPEVGSLTPQILLKNSHNGEGSIQMEIGIFRLVCSNGLVVADSQFAKIKRRHMGVNREEVMEIIYQAGREFPDVWSKVNDYKSLKLTNGQRFDFASKVVKFNWGENSVIDPNALLVTRRKQDESDDLFTTYNTVQENLIQGGATYMHPMRNRIRITRAVKDSDRDFRLNAMLWSTMENFRLTKKF